LVSRFKAFLILAAPFLLSALLLVCLSLTDDWLHRIQSGRKLVEWEVLARQGLHRLRASQSIESQLEMMGVQFETSIISLYKQSGSAALSGSGFIETSFQKAYPPTHRPAGTLLVAFGVGSDGRFKPFPHPALPRMKAKFLAELMDFYRSTADSGRIDPKHLKTISSKNTTIFGLWSTPRLLASREGRITPAIYEEQDRMIMWRTINVGSKVIGGTLIIWPRNTVVTAHPLNHALETAARAARGSFFPLLQPLPRFAGSRKPILPASTRAVARRYPRSFSKMLALLPQLRRGRIEVHENFMLFREYFSMDEPYEMLAIAPLRPGTTPISGARLAYRSLFLLFWGFIFMYVAWCGRPPPISLRTMFRILFLLVASLPLAALATFGYLQISTETARIINSTATSAIDTISGLDISSRQSLDRFTRVAQRVFSTPSFIDHVISSSSADVAQAATETFAQYRASGETLNRVFIFQPGQPGRSFSSAGEDRNAAENLDFFAAIINMTHNMLVSKFGKFDQSEIMLDTESQKSWRNIFENFGILQFSALFFNIMENGQMTAVGPEDIALHVSQIIFSHGSPGAYVVFTTPARDTQKIYMSNELNRLNLRYRAQHACGDITSGGATPFLPAPNAGFWYSSAGRALRTCLDQSAISDTPITVRRGNLLAVAAPCRTLGPMVAGSIWSLDEIYSSDTRNKLILALFVLLLSGFAVFLARMTADHLVTPLEAVEKTLRSVSAGDLSGSTGLSRADELGQMTRAFDEMISGLRERRELGKFVSGAIESALDTRNMSDVQAQKIMGTVLVTDIRAFTTMSETYSPTEIVEMLNVHMEAMTAAITRNGGRVDRFIGDAVVALFQTPEKDAGMSSALSAALEMNAAHSAINGDRIASGKFSYAIGIGISSGELMAGTLDGGRRRDFIVIGEPRSMAESLENLSRRGRHTRILVDENVAQALSGTYLFEPVPRQAASEVVMRKAPTR